jgi:L-ascorbate metabolism protein UlaG (beta-lactamase superfamily)
MTKIKWLGHDGFFIESEIITYIDPFRLDEFNNKIVENKFTPADLILISHTHHDHFSIEDIKKISKSRTLIVGPEEIKEELIKNNVEYGKFESILPNEEFEVQDIIVSTVRAYNIDKVFHPRENNWLGFLLEINNKYYYFAGDTDIIPEMNELKGIDVALIPVSGKYVMNSEEAVKTVVEIIKPLIAIPMHYNSIVGTDEDADYFVEQVIKSGFMARKLAKDDFLEL